MPNTRPSLGNQCCTYIGVNILEERPENLEKKVDTNKKNWGSARERRIEGEKKAENWAPVCADINCEEMTGR